MSLWSNILFNCAVLINLIVAFFYPFVDSVPSKFFSNNCFFYRINEFKCLFFFYCRTKFTFICSYLDGNVIVSSYCHYITTRIWYTNASSFNNITIDFFYRTKTNVMVTRFPYGNSFRNFLKNV